MLKSLLLVASVLFASSLASAQKPTLNAGDAAPAIQVKQWVKGEAVTSFAKDHIYVVEFWATWCPPCRESIPHLTELQKKHNDVTFIGVSVFEHEADQGKVAPFVEKMGEKMDYRVAMDDVPEGKKNNDGAMAKSWMIASGQGGIPTAFIVDKTGHVAWIGHPMNMEEPLDKILAGKWDLAAYQKEVAEEAALDDATQELNKQIGTAMRAKDSQGALAAMDKAFAATPKLESRFGPFKLKLLLDGADAGASAYGTKLVDTVFKDDGRQLNEIAWMLVDPDSKFEKPDLKLALKAAQRANELMKGADAGVLDTLARVYFVSGDSAKAIEIQTKAVELMKDKPDAVKELQGRLDEYKKGKPAGT